MKNGELNLHEQIVLSDSDIPTDEIIKITSLTIVIKSLIEKVNKFYLELALNHLSYKIIKKIKDPLFTYRVRLVNILDFNPKKLSIEKVLLTMGMNIFAILNTVEILFI